MHLSESTLASEPSQRQSLIVAAAHAAWRLRPSSSFDVCAARAAFRLHAAAATSEVSERLSKAIGSRGMCPAFAQQHTHSRESACRERGAYHGCWRSFTSFDADRCERSSVKRLLVARVCGVLQQFVARSVVKECVIRDSKVLLA